MGGVLVVVQAGHRVSEETLAAAQSLGAASAAVVGDAAALAGKKLEKVYSVQHELLAEYTADGYSTAFEQLIQQLKPSLVLLPRC